MARKSKVWDELIRIEVKGRLMARCPYCEKILTADSKKAGTSHLKRHLEMHRQKRPNGDASVGHEITVSVTPCFENKRQVTQTQGQRDDSVTEKRARLNNEKQLKRPIEDVVLVSKRKNLVVDNNKLIPDIPVQLAPQIKAIGHEITASVPPHSKNKRQVTQTWGQRDDGVAAKQARLNNEKQLKRPIEDVVLVSKSDNLVVDNNGLTPDIPVQLAPQNCNGSIGTLAAGMGQPLQPTGSNSELEVAFASSVTEVTNFTAERRQQNSRLYESVLQVNSERRQQNSGPYESVLKVNVLVGLLSEPISPLVEFEMKFTASWRTGYGNMFYSPKDIKSRREVTLRGYQRVKYEAENTYGNTSLTLQKIMKQLPAYDKKQRVNFAFTKPFVEGNRIGVGEIEIFYKTKSGPEFDKACRLCIFQRVISAILLILLESRRTSAAGPSELFGPCERCQSPIYSPMKAPVIIVHPLDQEFRPLTKEDIMELPPSPEEGGSSVPTLTPDAIEMPSFPEGGNRGVPK